MEGKVEKYQRTMMFSGGGSRIGIYGGLYSAFIEENLSPDLIIGTCGGALAANIISIFRKPHLIKEYIKSYEMYNFIISLELTKESKLYNIGFDFLKRVLKSKKDYYIEDIFSKYLVDIPEDLNNILSSLANEKNPLISTLIVGTKLLFDKKEVGRKCTGEKIYREILFTDKKTSQLIKNNFKEKNSLVFSKSLVEEKIEIIEDMDILKSTRISISDMFYTRPVFHEGNYYLGGAVDLVPLELAQSISEEIILEKKQKYDKIEDIAVKSVFGYGANERLKEIEGINLKNCYMIDTSDVPEKLKGNYTTSKINWKKFQVELSYPTSYEKYQNDIEKQWEYGYNKGKESILNKENI